MTIQRVLQISIFLGLAVLAYTQTDKEAPAALTVQRLKEDLFLIEGTSKGFADAGNVLVYVTGEGIVLIDDRFEEDYQQILAQIKTITNQPIRYVFNTHHHGDHTGTNAKFLPTAEIILHKNARKQMVQRAMPGIPRIDFSEEASVFLGGKEVRAIYTGRGHTDGDVTIYIPAHRTVHMGDLYTGTNGVSNPVVDYSSNGSLKAWPATLDKVLAMDIEIVVPGHGPVAAKQGLLDHRNKVAAIGGRLSSLVNQNKSKDDITAALIAEFDSKPINLRALDEMIAEVKR